MTCLNLGHFSLAQPEMPSSTPASLLLVGGLWWLAARCYGHGPIFGQRSADLQPGAGPATAIRRAGGRSSHPLPPDSTALVPLRRLGRPAILQAAFCLRYPWHIPGHDGTAREVLRGHYGGAPMWIAQTSEIEKFAEWPSYLVPSWHTPGYSPSGQAALGSTYSQHNAVAPSADRTGPAVVGSGSSPPLDATPPALPVATAGCGSMPSRRHPKPPARAIAPPCEGPWARHNGGGTAYCLSRRRQSRRSGRSWEYQVSSRLSNTRLPIAGLNIQQASAAATWFSTDRPEPTDSSRGN